MCVVLPRKLSTPDTAQSTAAAATLTYHQAPQGLLSCTCPALPVILALILVSTMFYLRCDNRGFY